MPVGGRWCVLSGRVAVLLHYVVSTSQWVWSSETTPLFRTGGNLARPVGRVVRVVISRGMSYSNTISVSIHRHIVDINGRVTMECLPDQSKAKFRVCSNQKCCFGSTQKSLSLLIVM